MQSHQKEKCHAWGSFCSACGRKYHWAKVSDNRHENKGRHPQTQFKPGHKETLGRQQYRHHYKKINVYSVNANQDNQEIYNQFAQMIFDTMKRQDKKDTRTEAFADLTIKLPNLPGTHKLKAKVDTGAEGISPPPPYVFSARCFQTKSAILDSHSLVQHIRSQLY